MYEPIVGLEIHVQLKTKTKMFCGCPAHETAVAPNTNVCPICMGHPGTLPVPNEQAIRSGVLVGLALNCEIAPVSKFDRKNYFYPDLPKSYQISQYDLPIASKGFLEIDVPLGRSSTGEPGAEEPRRRIRVGITRAHLEEDAAKNIHDASGKTYVDFNRAGTPLIEIVTEPDMRSPAEAKAFLTELRLIMRYLGVSDADMEKGHLRCDANISLRERDPVSGEVVGALFNPKTELKNINSFRHVERALEYEIQRQTRLWQEGNPPSVSTTRGWNDAKQITEEQRTKEGAEDYRYFPEPDISPLELTDLAEELRGRLPELPAARRRRFIEEYHLKPEDARVICEDLASANFIENVFSELQSWLNTLPELDGAEEAVWAREKAKLAKLVAGWFINKLGGLLAERGIDLRTISAKGGSASGGKIDAENFAEFIMLIATNKLSSSAGLTVLNAMLDDGSDPSHVMEDKKLGRMADEGELAEIVERVIAHHPEEVARYKAGKKELLQFFVGMVMKETEGSADAALTRNILLVKLEA
jgi:aspartyl-tRNA(Asn)/glutamyl-tRNA(Gln) amidotransferase subunit B